MTSPVIGTPWKKLNAPVSEEAIEGVDKYWRAANYLSIGQIYLRSNPLMSLSPAKTSSTVWSVTGAPPRA